MQDNQKSKGRGNWQSRNPNQEGDNERTTKKLGLLGSSSLTTQTASDAWVIDLGALEHMTERREWFSVFEKFDKTVKIEIGDSTFIDACGKGKIEIETFVNGKWLAGTLHDVLYIPNMKRNLFSVKFVAKKGIDFSISKNCKECTFLQNQKVIARGSDMGNLYKIDIRVVVPSVCNFGSKVESKSDTLHLWHERLCHQSVRHVK